MKKLLHKINVLYDKGIILLLIFFMLLGLYISYDAWYVRYVSSGNSFLAFKPKENVETLLELSDECIGWITIDNTTIDYPLMQGKDNNKYLNTGPDGKYSLAGSIFLDFQCDPEFNIPYSLIYGHKMSNNLMFGALEMWEDEKYFNAHLDGKIVTKTKEMPIKVFSYVVTDANEHSYFDPLGFKDQYEKIKENNVIFREIPEGSKIVALATCRDPGTTLRTILFAYIVE